MGGQKCKTCRHPRLRDIHVLKAGGTILQDLSEAFGLSVSTMQRHFHNDRCMARFEALECAPEAVQAVAAVAGEVAAHGRPAPVQTLPTRRRAIAHGPRVLVKPVSNLGLHTPEDEDHRNIAAAPIVPLRAQSVAQALRPSKSSIPADAAELSLLASFGATDQQLADLIGRGVGDVAGIIGGNRGDGRALFDTTNQYWAKHFTRLAMEELINLRRRRQAALDGMRWREAERFDPKIAKANNDLFLTLQRFGLVGPINPDELSKEGDWARGIIMSAANCIQGREEPELTPEEELRFQEAERRAVA